jgi:hypothetical protein
MKYLKKFEGLRYTDIKVSEANKIKSLPGFNFTRTESFFGYNLIGKRIELPMERIEISKDGDNFILDIRRSPGYFRDMIPAGDTGWEEDWSKERDWEFKFTFDDIESLMKFLVDYKWYDKLN